MNTYDNSEKLNDWAKIDTGKHLHISLAKSGLQGYYCIGCTKEMQAVKRKNPQHKDYFRHNATNVDKDSVECTFSSEEYRERLAGQIFARLKAINLPPVYKYPPTNEIGNPNLLSEKMRLEASSVKLNISFFENEMGELNWGKKPVIDDENILFKPDVTFFDSNDKPILLIEFVTKHKVTDEKKGMFKRLGINTVQIIVPRASEEEIEQKITSVQRVKWVYNETESNTKYIPIQQGDSERVPDIDEEQRKLFEESYACRAAQLKNLIRSIRRSVASQPYKRAVRQFELEIERVESVAKTDRSRLEELERNCEKEVLGEIAPTEVEIEQGFSNLEQHQVRFEEYFGGLEDRYIGARERLIEQAETLERAIREQLDQGAGGEALGAIYEARHGGLQRDTERIRNNIGNLIEEEENFRRYSEFLQIEEFDRFESAKFDESANFEQRKRRIEEARIKIESEIGDSGEITGAGARGIDAEFEILRNAAIERISQRDTSGNTELSKRIESVLAIRGFLSSYDERTNAYKRYKSYLELVRGGAWKTW